jgi:parallel beta-helix repeat protein
MNTGIDIETGSHISIEDNSISGSIVGIRYTLSSNCTLNGNKIQGCGIGIQISNPGKNNLVFSNQLKENNVGLYTDLIYKAMSITCNNFINNKIQILFSQTLLPLRQQTPRNPIFNYNYYTNWKGKGPMMLIGRTLLFVIPFFFPDFPLIFPIYIPCVYFDWNPANAPYYIP